jgi:23S rRNA pseudouridine1911/1915/1917 synthase
MGESVVHRVPAEGRGERLDRFLASHHQELSRSRLQALIQAGSVLVDGKPALPSRKLRGGESISVEIPAEAPAVPQAQALPLRILHEDEALLVVDKEAGMVIHPAAGVQEGTLVNALLFHVDELEASEEDPRPGIVHRLDKDTSGCLVVAKTQAAQQALQAAFQERVVEKRYLALVHGSPKEDRFTMDTPFGRHPTDRIRFTARNPVGIERRAITHVEVRERYTGASLVEVDLETGRTHQIRVHLSERGHPLLADVLYGGAKREARLRGQDPVRLAAQALGRQALHAWRLSFPHPTTGERLHFEAPLPADFEAALSILRAGR